MRDHAVYHDLQLPFDLCSAGADVRRHINDLELYLTVPSSSVLPYLHIDKTQILILILTGLIISLLILFLNLLPLILCVITKAYHLEDLVLDVLIVLENHVVKR